MPSGIVKLNNGDIMSIDDNFKDLTLKALELLRDENKQSLECTKLITNMLESLNARVQQLEEKQ